MRCSDPCACPCGNTRHDNATKDPSLLVLPVTADDSSGPTILYPAVHSLQSELSGNVEIYEPYLSWGSNGNEGQSMKQSPSKAFVIQDIHQPVDVSNGARAPGRSIAAALHRTSDISGRKEQKRSPSEAPQRIINTLGGFIHQLHENPPPVPSRPSSIPDTYAAVACEATHLPLVFAPNSQRSIDDSPKAIGSAQTKSQTRRQADTSVIARSNEAHQRGHVLSIQKAKPHPNASNTGLDTPRKGSVPISKSKENSPELLSPLKDYTPWLKAHPTEFDQGPMDLNHSPGENNVALTPRQTYVSPDNNGADVITTNTRKQEATQFEEEDLIIFDWVLWK